MARTLMAATQATQVQWSAAEQARWADLAARLDTLPPDPASWAAWVMELAAQRSDIGCTEDWEDTYERFYQVWRALPPETKSPLYTPIEGEEQRGRIIQPAD